MRYVVLFLSIGLLINSIVQVISSGGTDTGRMALGLIFFIVGIFGVVFSIIVIQLTNNK